MPSVMWFRRDLRLSDHPALTAAAAAGGDGVVPLFVLEPATWERASRVQRAYLARSLEALDEGLGGSLVVRVGDPASVIAALAREAGASSVHATADSRPLGSARDAVARDSLAETGVTLTWTGSPYAVDPGVVRTAAGGAYSVFTPFSRAWRRVGWPAPLPAASPRWVNGLASDRWPTEPDIAGVRLPLAGEEAALAKWAAFRAGRLGRYAECRDVPAVDGTSGMSVHLAWGEIHPRTLLADLDDGDAGAASYRTELAWREFYADVLWNRPESAYYWMRPEFAHMTYDAPDDVLDVWQAGRTGYPFVDAGMRQLASEGWMHNRLRMIVASFLVKDLHVQWQHGARHFLDLLVDADLASNQHGWQWVAGCGTDAAPYFRVFNPVTQGLRHDPGGDYVRRYVPELRHLAGASAHEPWKAPDGYSTGYPRRIVDHALERAEALRRYAEMRERAAAAAPNAAQARGRGPAGLRSSFEHPAGLVG